MSDDGASARPGDFVENARPAGLTDFSHTPQPASADTAHAQIRGLGGDASLTGPTDVIRTPEPDSPPSGGMRRRWGWIAANTVVALVSALVLSTMGYAWAKYHDLSTGMKKSNVLNSTGPSGAAEPKSLNGDTNILIMGLDSRLDENGNPLPQDIYNALHAGSSDNGGYNANVLMLLHVPGDGSRATEISIPRDDYVSFPTSYDGVTKGKIKQAYGLAKDEKERQLIKQGVTDKAALEQQSRDAGRKAEIDTVRQFLGGIAVDHFVEVTLVAFYEIAQVVQPITVCLNEDTADTYSGADFHKGYQQISASQAVAFVRQRRDTKYSGVIITDLDRERRQQAFISSVAYQLKQAGTFTDPSKLSAILNVAKQNIAIDDNLDLLTFAGEASNLTSGNITFNTLPIVGFGKDPKGEDINVVNVPAIQAIVRNLIGTPANSSGTTSVTPTTTAAAPAGTVDVVNSAAQQGIAGTVENALTAKGFTQGTASTGKKPVSHTVIYYGSGEDAAASAISTLLGGVSTKRDSSVPAGHVQVVLGEDFSMPSALRGSGTTNDSTTTTTSTAPSNSSSGANNTSSLNSISGGGIVCVP